MNTIARTELLADRVAEAWTRHFGPSRVEVPAGVCAAIALTLDLPARGNGLTELAALPELSPAEARREMWMRWGHINRLHPWGRSRWPCLYESLAPDALADPAIVDGVQAVAAACVEEGLPALLGDEETRLGIDVLGHIGHRLTGLLWVQGPSPLHDKRTVSGPTKTLLATTAPGMVLSIHRDAATLFPRLIDGLRRIGRSPASLRWRLREVNELPAAMLAASCVLWEAGEPLIGIAEHPEWIEEALEERERHDY